MRWSVLLLYPDYLAENYPRDTYFAYVETLGDNSNVAVINAQQQAAKANSNVRDFRDFLPLLCLRGYHEAEWDVILNW